MANGGTIPSSRTQTVTFYNTADIIERHKNLYYVPRFSKTGATANQAVSVAYLNAFNSICPPSSAYTNVTIASWSPEDRTLVVKGNIDDFRVVTEEGECLNYLIVERTVVKGTSTYVYHYAFFITEAKQAGGGSVTLSLIPDDFTNVFYLHNKHLLTVTDISNDYEPFNDSMKNCYVNRQHYNRVGYNNVMTIYLTTLVKNKIIAGKTYSLYINSDFYIMDLEAYEYYSNDTSIVVYFTDYDYPEGIDFSQYSGTLSIQVEDEDGVTVAVGTCSSGNYNNELTYANLEVFKNIEETFKYKYQYKDKKELSNKMGGIRDSIRYMVIELKGTEILSDYAYQFFDSSNNIIKTNTRYFECGGFATSAIQRKNATLVIPFVDSEDGENYNFQYIYKDENNVEHVVSLSHLDITSSKVANSINYLINKNALPDYIMACYIVKDINIPNDRIKVSGNKIKFYIDMPPIRNYAESTFPFPMENDRIYPARLKTAPTDNSDFLYQIRYISADTYSYINVSDNGGIPCLIVSGFMKRETEEFLTFSMPASVKTAYFDPVLEMQPYKFYSLSTLTYELPLNSARYLIGGNHAVFKYDHYLNINGGIKMSVVPYYTVNGYTYPYYSESMTFTYLHLLPLVSDSYSSYYYQNMSQMKNQFAVTDKNFTYDILQHLFVSGPNSVGYSAGKGGLSGGGAGAGAGALLETGNQVMQMVDETIDFFQTKEITEMNQKAKLADMGMKPDVAKQAGSDVYLDLQTKEDAVFLNHYSIDRLSYNSIAKLLERTGYQVNLYDTIHAVDRVGWNFVKLNGFDYNIKITVSQEDTIRKIFLEGITMLHDKTFLTSGHNYETILE